MNFIKAITAWFRRLFAFTNEEVKPPVRRKSARQKKEHFGVHYYLGDLLESLEDTFRHLPKMRKADPEAYGVYSRLGATVCNSEARFYSTPDPHILESLPSFGCAFIPHRKEGNLDGIPCRFIYFIRVKKPINIEPSNGAVYRVGYTWDDGGSPIYGGFHVAVEGKNVRALKECFATGHSVGRKKNDKNPRRQKATLYRMSWDYPRVAKDISAQCNQSVEQFAHDTFAMVANIAYARESGLTVTVTKRNRKAVFAIDMLRTPYFFADREQQVNKDGKTRKIFHYVKGHTRTLSGGVKKHIKPHFRGINEFEWNGYDVKIGLAGKHGLRLSTFNIDPIPEGDDREKAPDTIAIDEAAARISEALA